MMLAVRILVDPRDPKDLPAVHLLQDAVTVEQAEAGAFEIPEWDQASQKTVRDALLTLATTLPDTTAMFGTSATTDPVRRLIGAGYAWGGNPERDAFYLNVIPQLNDGHTVHRLTVSDVPVDGCWSITVYNPDGYLTANPQGAYAVNNLTAVPSDDGSVIVRFGESDDATPNCLPITPGWNYLVRLYRPRPEILDGTWAFPTGEPVDD
jgi:hypothetical protein